MTTKVKNLQQGLISELNRVREVLAVYEKIPTGAFGAAMIKMSISNAEAAMGDGDAIAMLKAYEDLKVIQA